MHIGLQVPWLVQRDFNRLELTGWGVVAQNTVYKAVVQVVDGVAVVEFSGFARRVVLAAIEGYSHKEIATELGITESTSRSNLVKARLRLQELLKEKIGM